jgi:hypothetical protein
MIALLQGEPMRILGIDQANSTPQELVLKTDPPLTQEVFDKFVEIWQVGDFDARDGSLVWMGAMGIQSDFIGEMEVNLIKAENAINQDKIRERHERNAFLHKMAEQTDLPLI